LGGESLNQLRRSVDELVVRISTGGRFDRIGAATRLANLGLFLGLSGAVVLFTCSILLSRLSLPDNWAYLAVSASLGAFFAVAGGFLFAIASFALSRAAWRRALLSAAVLPGLVALYALLVI
jgi:hypothetical protein